MPALFNKTSRLPPCSRTLAKAAATSSGFVTSNTRLPRTQSAESFLAVSATAFAEVSASQSFAPSSQNARAKQEPSCPPAPVIKTVILASRILVQTVETGTRHTASEGINQLPFL